MTATASQARSSFRASAAAALAVLALAGCGVNFGAQTDQVYTPADGENSRDGQVDVLNALIVSDTPGSGRLIGALVNNDPEADDALVDVSGAGEDSAVTFTLTSGDTTIPAGRLVQLADEDAATIAVSGDPEAFEAGGFVRVTFTFENADEVELNLPVLEPGETYADVEIPSATEPESPSESPTE